MRWMRTGGWMVLGLVLTGCAPAGAPPVDVPTVDSGLEERTPDTCGMADLEGLVGQPVSAFDQAAWDKPVRVVPPGAIITMEYNAQRLNIDTDQRDRITRLWCG